jgi:pimeloyl-ACP methyl ester carboxylesterase
VTINRRTFSALLASGGAAAFAAGCAAGTPSAPAGASATAATPAAPVPAGPRNVVLVHGAYADGSCWVDIIPRLQAAGVTVTAVQNPLTSLADDVAYTRRILAQQPGPVVLAAHSFGGTVITEAGTHPAVAALVYIATRRPWRSIPGTSR